MDVDSSEWGGFLYEDKQLSTCMDSEKANCYGGYHPVCGNMFCCTLSQNTEIVGNNQLF